MAKKACFFIDDVIWLFRDLARLRPTSVYSNGFMKMLKDAHDRYGMKVQLNIFLQTDIYYGNDIFKLSEMPDIYRFEFEASADWLKLGFHARQEFPDYPYVNASYDHVKTDLDETKAEVLRFAGNRSFSYAVIPHWNPISKDGCRALYDGGIRLLSVSHGNRTPYCGDPSVLPYGHAGRLLQNRKPETMLYRRGTRDAAIDASICAYNHISGKVFEETKTSFDFQRDEETGICFKKLSYGPYLNLTPLGEIEDECVVKGIGGEYFGYSTHEQYFYPEYFAYQPDYAEKIMKAAEIVQKNGYEYFFAEDMLK